MGYEQCMDITHGPFQESNGGVDHLDFGKTVLSLSGTIYFHNGPVHYGAVLRRDQVAQVSCNFTPQGWVCTIVRTGFIPGLPNYYSYLLESEEEARLFQSKLRKWLEG